MGKGDIRDIKLKELRSQETSESVKKSFLVMKKLLTIPEFSKSKEIFLYISTNNEVDTLLIADECLKSGKNVYGPITDKIIEVGKIKSLDELKPGKFGIKEPQISSKKDSFDIILVPGVVFDEYGSRIGHGGGYFDKFLSKTHGKKIGLAFDFQVIKKIASQPHDVPVDIIITEKRIIHIKNRKT